VRNAVYVLFLCLCASACSGPIGPIPGGALEGEEIAWPDDWSFTDNIENVLLQTDPEDPYSVTIWCVARANTLYFAAADKESHWVQNINDNSKVILSVDTRLIRGTASTVTERAEAEPVIQAYLEKYKIDSRDDFVQEDGLMFRLSKP